MAYQMLISDWSSDVCSSDHLVVPRNHHAAAQLVQHVGLSQYRRVDQTPLVKQPDTADMVNHVAEPAGRDQIRRTIVRMIVIQVMDFLPFRRPETAELAGMVVALQHNLPEIGRAHV